MRWIDVTLPLSEATPPWPGDPPFRRCIRQAMANGDHCNLSTLECGCHFGTHLDAPYHFNDNGLKVDELNLDLMIGPCLVIIVDGKEGVITSSQLTGLVPDGTLRLLVKTVNSGRIRLWEFDRSYRAFTPEAADWLLERGVRLLGLDYFSIGPFGDEGEETHRHWFRNNNTIALEGVDLSQVEPGDYQLICLPLKLAGGDGAPARVILGSSD